MSLPSPYVEPVWQALCDLSDESPKGVALRDDIWVRVGIEKKHLIDEAIKTLIEVRQVAFRVKPGVFAPIKRNEENDFSITVLENSYVKLEKGDKVMEFTPRAFARLKRLIA